MADFRKYVVFWNYGNDDLRSLLVKRATELGYYNIHRPGFYQSVTLCTVDGSLKQTSYDPQIDIKYEDHEVGNLKDFLTTDKYKYDPGISVGEYKVVFKEDGIQVGCTFVNKETVLKIAEKFKY